MIFEVGTVWRAKLGDPDEEAFFVASVGVVELVGDMIFIRQAGESRIQQEFCLLKLDEITFQKTKSAHGNYMAGKIRMVVPVAHGDNSVTMVITMKMILSTFKRLKQAIKGALDDATQK